MSGLSSSGAALRAAAEMAAQQRAGLGGQLPLSLEEHRDRPVSRVLRTERLQPRLHAGVVPLAAPQPDLHDAAALPHLRSARLPFAGIFQNQYGPRGRGLFIWKNVGNRETRRRVFPSKG